MDNLISKLAGAFGLKRKAAAPEQPNTRQLSTLPTMAFYKGLTYDNTYPAINKIAGEFMMLRPYAIDGNGKPLDRHPVIDALYHPNQSWSGLYFREVLAVMSLVHPKVYILVWRRDGDRLIAGGGGNISAENIAGFTVLEGVTERVSSEGVIYQHNGRTYSSGDIIELFAGVDPYDLARGYSPSVAAKKWANLDDYVAAYQSGLFENGAVPAGQFIITAQTAGDFNEIVDKMQSHYRGSGRNNNVIYTHRPVNALTGAAGLSQIEWVPFASGNNTLALGDLFEQANKKIDSALGVPASVRAVNDANTYASVRVDEQLFLRYTVKPFATRIWTQFTHELNRITGGLGIAITFDLDIPGVADEQKVDAERKAVELNIINSAVMAGYSLDSIIEAFNLPVSYKLLKTGGVGTAPIENHKPEVDEGGEAENAPDKNAVSDKKQVSAKKKIKKEKREKLGRKKFIDEIVRIANDISRRQADYVLKDLATKDDKIIIWDDVMVNGFAGVVDNYMGEVTDEEVRRGLAILEASGVDTSILPLDGFAVSQTVKDNYYNYLRKVARSYTGETAEMIRAELARAQSLGYNKEEIADAVLELVDGNAWRAQRLALTEEHKIYGDTSVATMGQLSDMAGVKIEKVWQSNVDACEFCRGMDGKAVDVASNFLSVGESVSGKDGGLMLNKFTDIESANLHPHCTCYVQYKVVD